MEQAKDSHPGGSSPPVLSEWAVNSPNAGSDGCNSHGRGIGFIQRKESHDCVGFVNSGNVHMGTVGGTQTHCDLFGKSEFPKLRKLGHIQLDIEDSQGAPFDWGGSGENPQHDFASSGKNRFRKLRKLGHIGELDFVDMETEQAPSHGGGIDSVSIFPKLRKLGHIQLDIEDIEDSQGAPCDGGGIGENLQTDFVSSGKNQFPKLRKLGHISELDIEDPASEQAPSHGGGIDSTSIHGDFPKIRKTSVQTPNFEFMKGCLQNQDSGRTGSSSQFKSRKTQTQLCFDGKIPRRQIGVLGPEETGVQNMSAEEKSALVLARMMENAWSD